MTKDDISREAARERLYDDAAYMAGRGWGFTTVRVAPNGVVLYSADGSRAFVEAIVEVDIRGKG